MGRMGISYLYVASAISPNNSTEAGNYVVTHLLSNPIVAGIIGGVIGASLTYIFSN